MTNNYSKYYDDFLYGLVFPPRRGEKGSYFIRRDRVLFDWIIQPVPEDIFVKGTGWVDLPEGYFIGEHGLMMPKTLVPDEAKTMAHVYSKTPIMTKALHAITTAEEIPKTEFDALGIPEYHIFYIDPSSSSKG